MMAENKPIEVSLQTKDGRAAVFFGNGYSLLHPFHRAKFTDNDNTFYTVQQYYEYSRALRCGDTGVARRILKYMKPSRCKETAENLTVPDDPCSREMYHLMLNG